MLTHSHSSAVPVSTSPINKAIISSALITTDCISHRKGQVSELPFELMQMIIDWAVIDMEATRDGSLLCALMHTSCLIRSVVKRSFEPLHLYEYYVIPVKNSVQVPLPRQLGAYVWDLAERSVCTDFSTKRYAPPLPLPENCGSIVTTSGLVADSADVRLELTSEAPDSTEHEVQRRESYNRWSIEEQSDSRGVYYELKNALSPQADAGEAEEDSRFEMPRAIHPYTRALSGTLAAPTQGAQLDIRLSLMLLSPKDRNIEVRWTKKWRFGTSQTYSS